MENFHESAWMLGIIQDKKSLSTDLYDIALPWAQRLLYVETSFEYSVNMARRRRRQGT